MVPIALLGVMGRTGRSYLRRPGAILQRFSAPQHSIFETTAEASTRAIPDEMRGAEAGAGPNGHALKSCGILASGGTTYILQQDVSSPGTCFSVQANNITLNLNGHTITYATAPGNQPRYGILAEACWDTSVAGNPCGGTADHLTVENGSITQGSAAPAYSHGIRIGQINGTNQLTVHDVTFTVSAISSIPIFTTFAGADSLIFKNTFQNNVTVIYNRHQIQGAAIKFTNSQGARNGQTIHDNTIVGGAQGGIFSASPGTQFYNNTIRQNGRYSNDFAIYEWGNNDAAFNNVISPVSGRGIQIGGGAVSVNGHGMGSNGAVAHDNKITVIELPQNCDYSPGGTGCNACEPAGAFGIQFDDNPSNGQAYNNTVTAKAEQCDAQALRLTDTGPGNSSHDNTYIASRIGSGTGKAVGLGFAVLPNHFSSTHDTFIGDTATVWVDWLGAAGGFTCLQCTLGKGSNPASNYVTFSFFNGGHPAAGLHFVDTTFTGGAAKDSTDMQAIGPNRLSAEYFIDWTYTLTVQNTLARPVAGASVTIRDARGEPAFTGTTDANGRVSAVLNELHMHNTSSAVIRQVNTPHTISVTAAGCTGAPAPYPVKVTQTITQTVQLQCKLDEKVPSK
ncbi:MAG: hypothetical protein LAN84_00740 [Acidobacteriia bacterium]|nr:hypothetical protein [Terriglobia bacterium]